MNRTKLLLLEVAVLDGGFHEANSDDWLAAHDLSWKNHFTLCMFWSVCLHFFVFETLIK